MPQLEPTPGDRLSKLEQDVTNLKSSLELMRRMNAPSARVRGKAGSYLFALILSLLLGYFAVSAERRGEELETWQWLPITVLIGMSLGVQVDPETVGKWLGK